MTHWTVNTLLQFASMIKHYQWLNPVIDLVHVVTHSPFGVSMAVRVIRVRFNKLFVTDGVLMTHAVMMWFYYFLLSILFLHFKRIRVILKFVLREFRGRRGYSRLHLRLLRHNDLPRFLQGSLRFQIGLLVQELLLKLFYFARHASVPLRHEDLLVLRIDLGWISERDWRSPISCLILGLVVRNRQFLWLSNFDRFRSISRRFCVAPA